MLTLSSASLKLYTRKDCIPLSSLSLLSGESGAAQIYVTGKPYARIPVTVESSLDAAAYAVHRVKGDFLRPDDGYYERREDCMYPDLLRRTSSWRSLSEIILVSLETIKPLK